MDSKMNVWLVDDHMGSCLITIGPTSIYLSNRTLLYHLESIAYISTIRLRYPRNWRSHKQRGTKRHLNLSSRLIIIIVHTNNSWRGWTCSEALFHQDMGDECQTSCSRGNGADIWLPQFTAYRIIEPEHSLLEILVSLTQFAHYNKITLHWSSFKSVTSYKHLMENRWKTAQAAQLNNNLPMSQQRWHRYPIKDVAHQRNKGVGQQLRCSSRWVDGRARWPVSDWLLSVDISYFHRMVTGNMSQTHRIQILLVSTWTNRFNCHFKSFFNFQAGCGACVTIRYNISSHSMTCFV